LDTKIYEINSR